MAALKDRAFLAVVLRHAALPETPVAESIEAVPAKLWGAVFDNGGGRVAGFLSPQWSLTRDGRNPGVGPRYVRAAEMAQEMGRPLLLLLDQDFHAPAGWWEQYEMAVAAHPEATAWAPLLADDDGRILSPMRLAGGRPRAPEMATEFPAAGHLALNSGLLVRTDDVLAAREVLRRCPLDFSDYALCRQMGLHGGRIARVQLELFHDLSTHHDVGWEERLARFRWFAHGARGWAGLERAHALGIAWWATGRALKLAGKTSNPRFLIALLKHFLLGFPPEAPAEH